MYDAQPSSAALADSVVEDAVKAAPTESASWLSVKILGKPIRTLLPLIGGLGIAAVMVCWFGWNIFSSRSSHSSQAETLPSASVWLDSEAIQPALQPSAPLSAQFSPQLSPPALQSDRPILEPNVSAQATENAEILTAQKLEIASLKQELAQINTRLDESNTHLTALQQGFAQLSAKVEHSPTLAKRLIAPAQPVRQTHSMVQIVNTADITPGQRQKHAIRLNRTRRVTSKQRAISAQKAKQQTTMPATRSKPEKTVKTARPEVQLKAVLEGRAWLQTQSGTSITVAPGEIVAGVGIVKEIDAEQGRVIFSNGVVLR